MSLTSELNAGPLAAWFRATFPLAPSVAAEVATALADATPSLPPGKVRAGHHGSVGGAWGMRLGFAVETAPPYYALYGAHNAGLIGWDNANALAAEFPTHARLPAPARGRTDDRLLDRPSPTGWLDLRHPSAQTPARVQTGNCPDTVAAVTGDLTDLLAKVGPGHLGEPETEVALARVCAVLSGWEDAYRRGQLSRGTAWLYPTAAANPPRPADLYNRVDPDQLRDLAALAELARETGLLEQLRALAGNPTGALGHQGPVFVPNFADGDLLLTHPDPGHGATLLDVKTVNRPQDPARLTTWLHQLLAYAFLDAESGDDWNIRHVGLLFARHARVITWPLDELATRLAGQPHTPTAAARLRGQFFTEFERTLTRLSAQIT